MRDRHDRVSEVVTRVRQEDPNAPIVDQMVEGGLEFVCPECGVADSDPFVAIGMWEEESRLVFYCVPCHRDSGQPPLPGGKHLPQTTVRILTRLSP